MRLSGGPASWPQTARGPYHYSSQPRYRLGLATGKDSRTGHSKRMLDRIHGDATWCYRYVEARRARCRQRVSRAYRHFDTPVTFGENACGALVGRCEEEMQPYLIVEGKAKIQQPFLPGSYLSGSVSQWSVLRRMRPAHDSRPGCVVYWLQAPIRPTPNALECGATTGGADEPTPILDQELYIGRVAAWM
jgi:hypothetical protein